MFGNVCRFSWLDQRIIDNEPALSAPRTRVPFQSRFELFCREMRSRSCDPGHVILLEPVSPTCFLILSYFSLRSQLGISYKLETRRVQWSNNDNDVFCFLHSS